MQAKKNLTVHIFVALALGLVLGEILFRVNMAWPEAAFVKHLQSVGVEGVIRLGGQAFVSLLKVLVVPLVFFSLICGVCASGSGRNISSMGLRTFVFYVATTAVAISFALLLALMIDPGAGVDLSAARALDLSEPPSIYQMFLNIFPKNFVAAMAEGNMLQIIVFSIMVGLGLLHSEEAGRRLLAICEDANTLMLRLVVLVMNLAPIAVFCLVTHAFATKGLAILLPLFKYIVTVVLALLLHASITYSGLLLIFTGANPARFISKMYPALLFAFSTASSAATMPITLRLVEKAIGVRNSVASFTVPLGATLNMDGTAIMQGVATVFIASAYSVDLVFADYLTVILTATLASIGTAAVPSAGLVTLSIVLLQVNLPAEAIGLIIGVDRVLDMMRTAVNVLGDATVTTIVAHKEKLWQREIFESNHAVTED